MPMLTFDKEGFRLALTALVRMAAKSDIPIPDRLEVLNEFCEELRGERIHDIVELGNYGSDMHDDIN